jgi:hypothetical protein
MLFVRAILEEFTEGLRSHPGFGIGHNCWIPQQAEACFVVRYKEFFQPGQFAFHDTLST